MVQSKFEPDITPAGIARLRARIESPAATQMAHVRGLVEPAPDMVDEIPGCRANGTCGRCVEFLQSGEGSPTLCARKLSKRSRRFGDRINGFIPTTGSGA